MSTSYTPLDPTQLSPAAQRALGAGPGKMMAARGIMPLPPADQLAVLYQLSLDTDHAIAQSARDTAAKLPEKLLAGTLGDPSMDPRVLDYFGVMSISKASVFDAVVLNTSTDDQTIATLARRCGAREADLIATNEQRILRTPEIIAAMYLNRQARMATIDRVVELAVRNQVRVPGLAAWDEVARAIQGTVEAVNPQHDAAFNMVISDHRDDSELTKGDAEQAPIERGETTENYLELLIQFPGQQTQRFTVKRMRTAVGSGHNAHVKLEGVPPSWLIVDVDKDERGMVVTLVETGQQVGAKIKQAINIGEIRVGLSEMPFRDLPIHYKIRAATVGDAYVRHEAIRDANRMVAMAAIKSPGVTDNEAALWAGNQILSEDVIRYISQRREWTKLYGVKVALCRNPKTPITETMKLMPFLRERDINDLIKSKGVPSAVVAQARKLHMQRKGGSK
jgi:hypothetical protein